MNSLVPKNISFPTSGKNTGMTVSQSNIIDGHASASYDVATSFVPMHHTSDSDIKDMKKILEKLYSATGNAAQTLNEDAREMPVIKEELETIIISNGVRFAKYEIRIRVLETSKSDKKIYDVVNSATSEIMAENLFLYEAAYGIVKLLNKGYTPLSESIRRVVGLEESYTRNRQDALFYKKRYREASEKGLDNKFSLYEARYQTSREYALKYKEELQKMVENII